MAADHRREAGGHAKGVWRFARRRRRAGGPHGGYDLPSTIESGRRRIELNGTSHRRRSRALGARSSMMRRMGWATLLLAICAVFYWKLLFTDQYSFLDSPDLANMELPRLHFLATQINHLRAPRATPN